MKTEIEVLNDDVAVLKRNLARQRWANVGLLVVGLVGFGAISARTQPDPKPVPQDLIVKSLRVVDENGKERIHIGTKAGNALVQMDSNTQERVVYITTDVDGGNIRLKSNTNKFAASIGADEEGGSVMVYSYENGVHKYGRSVASIFGHSDGGAALVLNKDGKVIFQAPKKVE